MRKNLPHTLINPFDNLQCRWDFLGFFRQARSPFHNWHQGLIV